MAQNSREYLQDQLVNLEQQQTQLQANSNAVQGAILFCKQLLTNCDAPEQDLQGDGGKSSE